MGKKEEKKMVMTSIDHRVAMQFHVPCGIVM